MFEVSVKGIGKNGAVTFLAASGVTVVNEGHVGKIGAAKTVDVCEAEDVFYGVIEKVDVGILAMERRGLNDVSYTGTIASGWKELVADGSGGVKAPVSAGTGRFFHVVDVNTTDKILTLDLG
jgi:hypothetical protein